jgi:AraC-like DNA-binding protein
MDVANIAQVVAAWRRYPGRVSPVTTVRRTTRATYQGHGVIVARVENDQRLWRGMKDCNAFVIPERGTLEFLYRGATYIQRPGTLQLKQPGEVYRDLRRDGPSTHTIVLFDPEVIARAREATATPADPAPAPQLSETDPRAATLLALRDLASYCDPLAIETAITQAALTMVSLAASLRLTGRESRTVQRARAYLLERLAEHIRLDDVADHVGIDKFHLIRMFHAEVGVPPYEFVTHARVHRARELLRKGVSAGSAATTVGFCDQSQLHRHFVRLVGVTPGRYAARVRGSAPA